MVCQPLRRVGVSFTEQQKRTNKKVMSLTGRQAEAQQMILKALKEQVGGAGEGAAGGLSGAFDTLEKIWHCFWKKNEVGKAVVVLLQVPINGLADAIGFFINEIEPVEETLSGFKFWLLKKVKKNNCKKYKKKLIN